MKGDTELNKGKLTVLSNHALMMDLAVRSVKDTKKKAIILDGCSKLNPYLVTKICKIYGFDENIVLERIIGARGFTAYQLYELIGKLDEELLGDQYSYLGVTGVDERFSDDELDPDEARWLRSRCMRKLKELVKEYDIYSTIIRGEKDG